jgi:hypothetical protein
MEKKKLVLSMKRRCSILKSCPGFHLLLINIMAGPSTDMHKSDGDVLCELLQENECSDICKHEYSSDSDINAKSSLSSQQSVHLMKKIMSVKQLHAAWYMDKVRS